MRQFALAMIASAMALPGATQAATPLALKAADGVAIHGEYYPAAKPRALILLFHQAGSSAAEYATIAPRLADAGYSALAIDQRSGGSMFGPNLTVAALGGQADYLAAKRDLEAALVWGERQKLPVILWGSSYSASLVFLVAAEHPGAVKALLAFSPGEYLGDKTMVRRAAAHVRVPIYVTSASSPDEIAAAKAIVDAAPAPFKQQFVSRTGIHGSSTLIAARNPNGAARNWPSVLAFLRRVAG